MNQTFFVALDRPAAACNVSAVVGDQFAVAIVIYEADGDEAPADLDFATASLELVRCGVKEITVAGVIEDGKATFDLDGKNFACLVGRSALRVKLTRDGRTVTVVDGSFTVSR